MKGLKIVFEYMDIEELHVTLIALASLLVRKGIITAEEWEDMIAGAR